MKEILVAMFSDKYFMVILGMSGILALTIAEAIISKEIDMRWIFLLWVISGIIRIFIHNL